MIRGVNNLWNRRYKPQNCSRNSARWNSIRGRVGRNKRKPSVPYGKIGHDAFGRKPSFIDQGMRLKGILAVGEQDISPSTTYPLDDKDIEVACKQRSHDNRSNQI